MHIVFPWTAGFTQLSYYQIITVTLYDMIRIKSWPDLCVVRYTQMKDLQTEAENKYVLLKHNVSVNQSASSALQKKKKNHSSEFKEIFFLSIEDFFFH